jgi:hypothetical protein
MSSARSLPCWRAYLTSSRARARTAPSFVPQQPQRTQHGVGVDAQDGSQVPGGREPHLAACFAIPTTPPPVTPGTVVALRGRVTEKPIGPGSWRLVFPKGPAVVSEHISNNYDQTFRLALPPGHYVIAGRYDQSSFYGPFSEVTVTVGATIRVNLPDVCA